MRDFIFIKNNSEYSRILLPDLMYVEAAGKYVRLITLNNKYVVLGSLSYLEPRLPCDQFCRIHRSYIVSFRHTESFTNKIVCIAGQKLPLSRQYRMLFCDRAEIVCADGTTPKLSEGGVDKLIERL